MGVTATTGCSYHRERWRGCANKGNTWVEQEKTDAESYWTSLTQKIRSCHHAKCLITSPLPPLSPSLILFILFFHLQYLLQVNQRQIGCERAEYIQAIAVETEGWKDEGWRLHSGALAAHCTTDLLSSPKPFIYWQAIKPRQGCWSSRVISVFGCVVITGSIIQFALKKIFWFKLLLMIFFWMKVDFRCHCKWI